MIQLPRKKSRKRIIVIVLAITLVLSALGAGAYAFYKTRSPSKPTDSQQPSTPPTLPKPTDRLHVEPHDHDPGAQQRGVDDVHTSDESAGAAAFPTTQPNLTVEITDIKQAGNQLAVMTAITPKAEGICTVELTRLGSVPRTKKSSLVTTGNTTSCKDATLDINQLLREEWTLTVKVQVNDNVATATKTVMLK